MQIKNNLIKDVTGFIWDEGNINKNKSKHGLDFWTIEEVFFNKPLIIDFDNKHSLTEQRWFALGKTDNNERIMAVFTIRSNKLRIISARKMNKNERLIYEKAETNTNF
jgi:hypothetical protein